MASLLLPLLAWSAFALGAFAQLSSPIAHNHQLSESDSANKFRVRQADADKEGDIQHEGPVPGVQRCGRHRLDLSWMSEASSSVYATPLITDLHADGRRDIIVPSFVHYLEVLEGPNGGQSVGWPAFHASSVHASPLLYDIDFDGVRDILLATYDGQIMFFKDTGDKLPEGLQISRLRVRKDWYVGLDPTDPFDHSHPDVGDGGAAGGGQAKGKGGSGGTPSRGSSSGRVGGGAGAGGRRSGGGGQGGDAATVYSAPVSSMEERVRKFVRQITEYRHTYGDAAADKLMSETRVTNAVFYQAVMQALREALLANVTSTATAKSAQQHQYDSGSSSSGGNGRRRLMAVAQNDGSNDSGGSGSGDGAIAITVESAGDGELISKEAAESFDIFNIDDANQIEITEDDADSAAAAAANAERARHHEMRDAAEAAISAGNNGGGGGSGNINASLDPSSLQSLDNFLGRLEYDEFGDLETTASYVEGTAAEHEHGVDPRAADPDELLTDSYHHLYLGDYITSTTPGGNSRGGQRGKDWQDEEFTQSSHPSSSGGYVYVDPHVMANPVIADIDGDGHDELVVAVSYFYDREYYDDPEHAKDIKDIDVGKYVASGVAVFDLRTRREKWVQHLDLSTDATQYRAFAYSSPTLVDLDGDGRLEVVVGTSMGFLYVLDHNGSPVPGWPLQMGEIQAQPLVADINNDGALEIVIGDMRGNIAAFTAKGEEVWERHVRSAISQGAVAGDIDGDGQLEVVFGSSSGYVYALAGSTGADIPNWPYRARGRVQAQPTITHLMEGSGLQVVVPAFDGFLYVIDGLQGCADVADLGETAYAAVLVDDIDGDGALELLATTMSGNVYAWETGAPYHPLATWTEQVLGPNGQVARWGYAGIFAPPAARRPRDVAGERLQVTFEVVDKRVAFADNGTLLPGGRGPYNVTVVLKGVGVKEMAAGEAPVVGVADSFPGPGKYTVDIPCPKTLASAVVRLELVDGSGLLYWDEFPLSFHMSYHRLLKWAIALPLGLMVGLIGAALASSGSSGSGSSNINIRAV